MLKLTKKFNKHTYVDHTFSKVKGGLVTSESISIPDADQKDRTSGNENDSIEDRSMLKRNTINQTIDLSDGFWS